MELLLLVTSLVSLGSNGTLSGIKGEDLLGGLVFNGISTVITFEEGPELSILTVDSVFLGNKSSVSSEDLTRVDSPDSNVGGVRERTSDEEVLVLATPESVSSELGTSILGDTVDVQSSLEGRVEESISGTIFNLDLSLSIDSDESEKLSSLTVTVFLVDSFVLASDS
jgi:hypothetical protein